MKRYFIGVILSLTILFSGCAVQNDTLRTQYIPFYYRTVAEENTISNSVIGYENYDNSKYTYSLATLLNEYLKGPTSDALETPFPEGTKIESLDFYGTRIKILMSSHLNTLGSTDLMIACSCLSQTVMSITGSHHIEISIDGSLINGEESLIILNGSIVTADNYKINH